MGLRDPNDPTYRRPLTQAFLSCGQRSEGGLFHPGGDRKIQVKPETAPPSRIAFDPQGAAHQIEKLATDGQPQAGAAKTPGGRGISLLEGLEEAAEIRRCDADAGVGHVNPYPGAT